MKTTTYDKSMGSRIRAIRDRLHLNQTQFGGLFGVTQEAVSFWEKGGNPDLQTLLKIAKRADTTVEWIVTGKVKKTRRLSAVENGNGARSRKALKVAPILADTVSDGPPKEITERDYSGQHPVPPLLWKKEVFLVRMRDNSMEPILRKGDILALAEWPEELNFLKGFIAAAWLPKKGITVRWLASNPREWVLRAEKKGVAPICINKKETVRLFRVIWWWSFQSPLP